jgi:signal peptidase I
MAVDSQKNKTKEENKKGESPLYSALSLLVIIIIVFGFKSSILDANNIPSGSMIPTLKIGDFLFVNKMRYSFRMPFSEQELIRYDNPKRGDIVTFIPPEGAIQEDTPVEIDGEIPKRPSQIPIIGNIFAKRFVKRIVGMPGDDVRLSQVNMQTTRGDFVNYAFLEFRESGSNEFKNFEPTPVAHGKELTDLDNTRAIGRSLFLETKGNFKHFVLEGETNSGYSFIRRHCKLGACKIPEGYYMVMGDNRDDSSDSRFWGFVSREAILGKALIIYFSIDWKDYTCMFKGSPEDNTVESFNAMLYKQDEIINHCSTTELEGKFQEEGLSGWLIRTLRYRIWRMGVRWSRIGRILQ